MRKDCPVAIPVSSASIIVQTPVARVGEVNKSIDRELAERLISPSPRGTIQIGGIQVGCVYDTGAETSVIPSSVFHSQLKGTLGEDGMKKMD